MHYTAMAGMHLVPPSQGSHPPRRRAGRVVANAVAGRGAALLRDCGGLPAVAGAGSAREGAQRRRMRSPSFPGQSPSSRGYPPADSSAATTSSRLGRRRSAASASRPAPHRRHDCRSKAPTAPISSTAPTSGASGPTLTIQRCMTAPGADVPVVDFGGRSPARPRTVRPGAPQPHRGNGARHAGSQGRRRRDRRTRRSRRRIACR